MYTVTRGKYYHTVELACSGTYSDCPSASLMPKWFSPKKGPSLYLTIRGAPGCGSRPVLSGNSTNNEPLVMAMERKFFLTLQARPGRGRGCTGLLGPGLGGGGSSDAGERARWAPTSCSVGKTAAWHVTHRRQQPPHTPPPPHPTYPPTQPTPPPPHPPTPPPARRIWCWTAATRGPACTPTPRAA
jgi:hypothetical protein